MHPSARAHTRCSELTTSSCIIIACRPIACTSASIAALKSANGTSRRGGVDDDDHGEVVADQRLRDVEDVAAELGDARGHARDDALVVAPGRGQHRAVARARPLLLEARLAVVDAGADLDQRRSPPRRCRWPTSPRRRRPRAPRAARRPCAATTWRATWRTSVGAIAGDVVARDDDAAGARLFGRERRHDGVGIDGEGATVGDGGNLGVADDPRHIAGESNRSRRSYDELLATSASIREHESFREACSLMERSASAWATERAHTRAAHGLRSASDGVDSTWAMELAPQSAYVGITLRLGGRQTAPVLLTDRADGARRVAIHHVRATSGCGSHGARWVWVRRFGGHGVFG